MRKDEQTYFTFLGGLPDAMGALRLRSDATALTAIDFAGYTAGYGPDFGAEPTGWRRGRRASDLAPGRGRAA